MLRRTSLALLAVPALALPVLAVPPAAAAPATRVVQVFPTDALTVPDAAQLTGRRVALPQPDCAQRLTDCRTVRLLNQLDGFDLDPRLAVTFDDAVDAYAVAAAMRVRRADGGFSTGVDRVVYDPETHTVYAHPQRQLAPGTEHVLEVQAGRGVPGARSTFTTLSATDGLLDMRRAARQRRGATRRPGSSPAATASCACRRWCPRRARRSRTSATSATRAAPRRCRCPTCPRPAPARTSSARSARRSGSTASPSSRRSPPGPTARRWSARSGSASS